MGGETTLVLVPHGAIVGQVVDEATGRPITAFNVKRDRTSPYGRKEHPPGSFLRALTQRGLACRPKDGKFVISELDYGATYALVACADGYAPAIAYPIVAQALDGEAGPWSSRPTEG